MLKRCGEMHAHRTLSETKTQIHMHTRKKKKACQSRTSTSGTAAEGLFFPPLFHAIKEAICSYTRYLFFLFFPVQMLACFHIHNNKVQLPSYRGGRARALTHLASSSIKQRGKKKTGKGSIICMSNKQKKK